MTRSEVQAFIDGYTKAGGDPEKIKKNLLDWLENHPIYPQPKSMRDIVSEDLESYRGIPNTIPQLIDGEIVT